MKQQRNAGTANDPLKLLFEVDEAAVILKISVRHLHSIKCKELDPENNKLIRYINNGKRVLFPREEIERYIKDEMKRQWGT
ncbi:helix-turn-helix domain-containing protein [candidate division KSB1 bacterium]|nr:helix-turn-helix domain-containing protein [candidate division KSB1 bacterium]NIR68709.1 helix-turn-helix domain-containing protein [candidate division KSB1 bacterium]NIS25526.1 helix-turn-helix domain-containing protein [candidate division KSB1 bacterium]NIT72419.1 helix-turn-helix domain-containing protein [candidate division KSB1 bacterium]NIU26203.1 helix-turn-helix domain-containing protein [candidate division KSB1 bacterium]